ncbi:hypothetical protein COV18_03370 [Candidatus Woesearchaeota archaeon CG10_big_fil_rev_8_21_14_0_10_37_12]|nr:MAG: hypothetical protein COV18_03370 [Candidatus Woesearchaeota archaeon CG10_big_fil_rev_8_21_14_0_10_37_12]
MKQWEIAIKKFPDQKFVNMFINTIELNEKKMIDSYKWLTWHVLGKMGGFNIDGWKLRTPAQ